MSRLILVIFLALVFSNCAKKSEDFFDNFQYIGCVGGADWPTIRVIEDALAKKKIKSSCFGSAVYGVYVEKGKTAEATRILTSTPGLLWRPDKLEAGKPYGGPYWYVAPPPKGP